MATSRCDKCLNDFALTSFPDLSRGMICEACMTGQRVKNADKVLKERAKEIAGSLAAMSGSEIHKQIGSVSAILGEVYGAFGGPSGYASQLHLVLMELCNRRPLPPAVGHIMINILKLHHTVEQSTKELSLKEMTLEQLKRETEMATLQYIADAMTDPEKRKVLDGLFSRFGVSIEESTPKKMIEGISRTIEDDSQLKSLSAQFTDTVTPTEQQSSMPTEEEIEAFLNKRR